MSSSMTHTYFGMDVYQELPLKYKNKINTKLEHFKIFSQGSDPFMFYRFFIGKKANDSKSIQSIMHTEKTQAFFISIIKMIHHDGLINNHEVMAYLYGYICHYYLDLYGHPFIYYKTGVFKKEDKNTYKYNGIHQEMEYMIDNYFVDKREQGKFYKYKIHQGIFSLVPFSHELKKIIDKSIKDTYDYDNISEHYEKCLKYMKLFFYLANYDPYGLKLKVYKMLDKIKSDKMIKLQELSYFNNYKIDYLNLDHKIWYYPWDNTKGFYTSFIDLYNLSKDRAIKTIVEVTDLLEEKVLDIDRLKKIFPNLSFVTGLPCEKEVEFKYFEF